ncbi:MAG: hypothetical protein V7L31_25000 [Nostoc sp.]|uniref:hypothetical protein n=1 Tax=Nostoc sp. TaxID=1180 RepID=UPI002FEF91D5
MPDEDVIIKGRIDTLVLKEQLWVMIIESKRASFSVEQGLAQILAYLYRLIIYSHNRSDR